MAGVVDAGRYEDGRSPVIVQTRLQAKVLNNAGDNSLLALTSAHQFLHGRPAFA